MTSEGFARQAAVAAGVHIRWMIRRDMPEVFAIANQGFEHPWSEQEFLRRLRNRCCIGMVAERGERIVGWMVYELHRKRLRLLRLAVAADCRRQGVGRAMIAKLVGKLSPDRRTRVTLACPETNLSAQRWLAASGFRARKVVRGYVEETDEDAYVFCYELATDPTD